MMGALLLAALAAAAGLCMARLVRGPTPYDRLLMAHALWMLAALLLAGLGALGDAPALIDGAIAVALMDGVIVLAAVKALRRNSFQPALAPAEEGAGP
ncbi:MAG: hypothetical protein NW200_11690 [Hyphomonadaceae bacterium]|nr:hypothetical protein [Hyphomonadaceae bacterium]